MKVDQWAIGYSYDLPFDLTFMLEGYYKNMKNLLEYRDGAGYMAGADNWEKQVAVGNGRSFGAEVLLRRQSENTDGWISYTWSKALRKFDRDGNVVNNGDEFYAMNDRRHNFNMFVSHRFPSGWKVSTSWTYQTGRCGTIASIAALVVTWKTIRTEIRNGRRFLARMCCGYMCRNVIIIGCRRFIGLTSVSPIFSVMAGEKAIST